MSLAKHPPHRSRAFLKFCHTQGGVCCLCGKPWTELHHFGSDGGTRLKPSDNEVCRLCVNCHRDSGHKRKALIRNGYYETLEAFQNDALELNRAYIRELENG